MSYHLSQADCARHDERYRWFLFGDDDWHGIVFVVVRIQW
jgi:hypothetical protein